MSIRDDLFSLGFENFEARLDAALSPSRATKSPARATKSPGIFAGRSQRLTDVRQTWL